MIIEQNPKSTIVSLLVLLATCAAIATAGDKTELKWRNFEAGFAEAKISHKKIMLDVYTDWCGWCKRLDRDVYGNEEVAKYLIEEYVVIKLNAESNAKIRFDDTIYTEAELSQAFGVTGYPAIIFFDSTGAPLNKLAGYVPANEFLPIIRYFGDDSYKTISWNDYRKQHPPVEQPKASKKK